MSRDTLAATFLAAALVPSSAVAPRAAGPTRADAASLQKKVTSITEHAARPTRRILRTTLTENEVNAYLAYDAGGQLPAGVIEPVITVIGPGRLTGRAVVDLDAVRKQKPRGLLDPMNLLTGRLALTATGMLRTSDGQGRFELETAALGPVPIPKVILQEIVGYYSRTPERPAGIAIDDPFALPAGIREIQVGAGRAVVIQ